LVNDKQRVAIADKVDDSWEKLAAYLAPDLFTTNKVSTIRKDNASRNLQAKAMLDLWSKEKGIQATCEKMIKALLDMHLKAQAVAVFSRELVEFVDLQCRVAEVC
jgi:hypothetical protein